MWKELQAEIRRFPKSNFVSEGFLRALRCKIQVIGHCTLVNAGHQGELI